VKLFSHRYEFKPIKSVIQTESMDDELRIGLWNALTTYYWDKAVSTLTNYLRRGYFLSENPNLKKLMMKLWKDYFPKPTDTLSNDWIEVRKQLREYFFSCEWYEVYDFIQFVAESYTSPKYQPDHNNSLFRIHCNSILERELSAYRFVDGVITKIVSESEIQSIEEATKVPISPVRIHLRRSLELLSERKNPDYRNSIKEAISAVEALSQKITGNEKATLGEALNVLDDLHPALKSSFKKLYGYTSEADGIRHALSDKDNLTFDDAKFMLVVCSAFVNYVSPKKSQ